MKKLVRMSLVAAVAVAGLTTSASAMEGLSVSGKVAVKLASTSIKKGENKGTTNLHDIDFDIMLNQKINDKLSATVEFQADSKQIENTPAAGQNADMSKAYFTYDNSGFVGQFGLQTIDTPVTDGEKGTGLVATYSPAENITIAAAHFINNAKGESENTLTIVGGEVVSTTTANATAKAQIAAAAIIASVGPVNLELWHVNINGLVSSNTISASTEVAGLNLSAIYGMSKFEDKLVGANNGYDGKTLKVSASYDAKVAEVRATYYNTDKKGGALATDTGAQTAFELEELALTGEAEATAFAVGVTVPVGQFSLSADYLAAEVVKDKASEIYLAAETKVASTTTVSVGYSIVTTTPDVGDKNEGHVANVNVKYTF